MAVLEEGRVGVTVRACAGDEITTDNYDDPAAGREDLDDPDSGDAAEWEWDM